MIDQEEQEILIIIESTYMIEAENKVKEKTVYISNNTKKTSNIYI